MPAISGVLTGKPRWPVREQYIVARVGAHHVVATDGLTDDPLFPSDPDSFGIEVWAETDEPLANVEKPWLASLVETVGYHVAAGDLQAWWFEGEPGCVSFEIPTSELLFHEQRDGAAVPGAWPAAWVTERDTSAMLIGVRNPDRPDRLADPFAAIRYLNVRVITPRELDEILAGGTPAALRIAAGGTTSRLTSRTP